MPTPRFERRPRTAVFLVKHRARAYAKRPMTLENVFPGLAAATPETMVAVAKQVIETERQAPRRWFGCGGEVPILNAKAVLLLARARRRWTKQQRDAQQIGAIEVETLHRLG